MDRDLIAGASPQHIEEGLEGRSGALVLMSMQAGHGLASLLQQLDEGNSGQRLRALGKLQVRSCLLRAYALVFTLFLVTVSEPPGQEVPMIHRLLLLVLGAHQALAVTADMHAPAAVSHSPGSLSVQQPAAAYHVLQGSLLSQAWGRFIILRVLHSSWLSS